MHDTTPQGSLARRAARNTAAREIAKDTYETDDVEVSATLDYVDGGYWIHARVFVSHDSVDEKLQQEAR